MPNTPSRLARGLVAGIALCTTVASAGSAEGQDTKSLGKDSAQARAYPFTPPVSAFNRHDPQRFLAMLLATAATMPFDQRIASYFAQPSIADNPTYQDITDVLTKIHERSLFFASVATYGVGRVAGWSTIADVGFHAGEAIAIGTVVGSILKPTIGRARPYAVNGSEPFEFQFGKGYTDGRYRAFPSLHEIGSFAAASVLTEEVGWRNPEAKPYVAVFSYGLAGLVGIGRIYSEQHWASDVVLGSAMGAFIGRRVVRYAHSRSRSRMDRWFLGATRTPEGSSRLSVTYTF
jgi:membrane-associated phospholipid phosphatase